MSFLATTRGALLRGVTTEDDLGDEIEDNATPVVGWDDFPMSLIERSKREWDPDSNLWRSIAYKVARVPSTLPVEAGDRIRDNRDGAVYPVDSIRREPRSLAGRASVTLQLRRTAP